MKEELISKIKGYDGSDPELLAKELLDIIGHGASQPNIYIDSDALRFDFKDGSAVNLFWDNLFYPMEHQNFQREVMMNLYKAYNECVIKEHEEPETQSE